MNLHRGKCDLGETATLIAANAFVPTQDKRYFYFMSLGEDKGLPDMYSDLI